LTSLNVICRYKPALLLDSVSAGVYVFASVVCLSPVCPQNRKTTIASSRKPRHLPACFTNRLAVVQLQ